MPFILVALFVGMVAVALWGVAAVPDDRRFSARAGAPPSIDGTMGKRTGLLVWVLLGAVVLAGSLMAREDNEGLALAGAVLLAFLLLMEIVSVRRLIR